MPNLHLTLAMFDYDHVRDLTSGLVRPKGIDLTYLQMEVEEIFYRFSNALEWDVSELSFAKFCSVQSQENPPFVGIPVFVSRVFRHSAFYVRKGGKVRTPADLKGKRIGIPEWSQTATVYARGWLHHQVGVKLTDVDWVQGGLNEPGRVEMAKLKLPAGVRYTQVHDRSLSELLIKGEIDALISARPPAVFLQGHPEVTRLLANYRDAELEYFRATKIYPIMHTVAIRRDVYDKHPWVAGNLLEAFDEARRRSVARLKAVTASQIPVPWIYDTVESLEREFWPVAGWWAYGIEPNRPTIEAFLQYCYEQGLCHRRLTPEELYPREVQSVFKT